MNRSASADRLAWLVLAFGLIAPWWLPLQSQPIPTFYKEWLAVLALAIGGLSLGPPFTGRRGLSIRHPLILAVFAIGLVLLVQSVAIEVSGLCNHRRLVFLFLLTEDCQLQESEYDHKNYNAFHGYFSL